MQNYTFKCGECIMTRAKATNDGCNYDIARLLHCFQSSECEGFFVLSLFKIMQVIMKKEETLLCVRGGGGGKFCLWGNGATQSAAFCIMCILGMRILRILAVFWAGIPVSSAQIVEVTQEARRWPSPASWTRYHRNTLLVV